METALVLFVVFVLAPLGVVSLVADFPGDGRPLPPRRFRPSRRVSRHNRNR